MRLRSNSQKFRTYHNSVYSSYLAQAVNARYLANNFKRSRNAIRFAIQDTCCHLWEGLKGDYMPVPNTESFLGMASRFKSRWQLPTACFALDGKHIRITKPKHSGTLYYNYKKYFSIILLAGCDADYKFVFVDGGFGLMVVSLITRSWEGDLKQTTLGFPHQRIFLMVDR